MTDPIFAALLMVGGITGILMLFAGMISVADNVSRHLRAARYARRTMHNHIRRMK